MNEVGLDQLPEEVAALVQQHEQEKIVKRESFSQMVSKKRDEAVSGRSNSGIEGQWTEDDEHYNGIDNANRATVRTMKPLNPQSGMSPMQIGRAHV